MVGKKRDSTKRFGPRYGRKLKERLADAEAGHRGKHKCPYCAKNTAKRLAAGIWTCKSCNVKFTGKAYSMSKKAAIQDVIGEIKKTDNSDDVEKEEE